MISHVSVSGDPTKGASFTTNQLRDLVVPNSDTFFLVTWYNTMNESLAGTVCTTLTSPSPS